MNTQQAARRGVVNADGAGLFASIACAIHCAAMPLVIGYLPMLGLSWLADESFHKVMAGVCFVLALFAFLPGWRKHGSLAPACVGSAGVALLTVAAFGLEGACCPACTAVPTSEELCTPSSDTGCVHCLSQPRLAEPARGASTGGSLAWAIPFITPVGGLFLVAGHVCNHRCTNACCNSVCCTRDSVPPVRPSSTLERTGEHSSLEDSLGIRRS